MIDPSEVADVFELWIWGTGESRTLSALQEDIETGIPEDALPTDEGGISGSELLAQQIFEILAARQLQIQDGYPFECDGYSLRYRDDSPQSCPYIFCLLLSYLPAHLIGPAQRAPQFELLAMEAARNYFGGAAVRIGWPWSASSYEELLGQVLELLPELGQISLDETVTAGDRGWDILVVKGFQDNEFPRFTALGNCATGRNNWRLKGAETQPEYFWESFQRQRPGTWITFSAVPFCMDQDTRHRKVTSTNLTFDRYRICEYAGSLPQGAEEWVLQQHVNAANIALDTSS